MKSPAFWVVFRRFEFVGGSVASIPVHTCDTEDEAKAWMDALDFEKVFTPEVKAMLPALGIFAVSHVPMGLKKPDSMIVIPRIVPPQQVNGN